MDNIQNILCTSSAAPTVTNTINNPSVPSSVVFCYSTTMLSSIAQTYASVLNKSNDTFALGKRFFDISIYFLMEK